MNASQSAYRDLYRKTVMARETLASIRAAPLAAWQKQARNGYDSLRADLLATWQELDPNDREEFLHPDCVGVPPGYGKDPLSPEFPRIVCLCGSTRFTDAFSLANFEETFSGRVVLTIGCDTKAAQSISLSAEDKANLDELHLRKVELADEVLVLNVGGYIGSSTRRELEHARKLGKVVRFLEPEVPEQ